MVNLSGLDSGVHFVNRIKSFELNNVSIAKHNLATAKRAGDRLAHQFKYSTKTGKIYNGIRASAPYEYPAVRTGNLMRSIRYNASNWHLDYGTNTPYAKFLAKGTRKMKPRRMSYYLLNDELLVYYLGMFPNFVNTHIIKRRK